MESLLLGEGRLGPYQPVGVVPSGYYQSAAKLEVHNASTGYLSSDYVNSTVDHFAMNFWSAGCNVHAATSPHPGGTSPPTLPIPANCTIKVEGYSKLDPFTPIATARFKYRPEITLNYNLPSATMKNYTFPRTFRYLDKFVMTATLDNIPPNIGIFYTGNGSAYDPSSGIQLLFTDVDYDISRLQITE